MRRDYSEDGWLCRALAERCRVIKEAMLEISRTCQAEAKKRQGLRKELKTRIQALVEERWAS
eukprot:4020314-Karenia_brevis.AAC.1